MLRLQDKTRKSDKILLLTRTCIKLTNKLVSPLSRTPLVLRQATGNFGLTILTTTRTWGKHHLPPYSILYTTLQEWHPNGFLFRDSQVGVPKSPSMGVLQLCGTIISGANLRLGRGLNQNCSPFRELSNDVSHATCAQGN
jgi:hypothetical protein